MSRYTYTVNLDTGDDATQMDADQVLRLWFEQLPEEAFPVQHMLTVTIPNADGSERQVVEASFP